jgi:hypothetical protein
MVNGTITNDGTVKVTDNSTVNMAAGAGQDNFVFAPNFGQATISHFTPGLDSLQIDHATFANLDALFAATHDIPTATPSSRMPHVTQSPLRMSLPHNCSHTRATFIWYNS